MLLVKLLLAHLLGDFVFQPDSWAKQKSKYKLKSAELYLHFLVHAVLVFIIVWRWDLWKLLLLYLLVHFTIDIIKVLLQKEKNRKRLFFIDQGLHILTIVLFWYFIETPGLNFISLINLNGLIIITAVVFLTLPSAIIIRELMKGWSEKIEDDENESLKNAGKYIGILERLFVLLFFLLNQWIAIGFLITAKSVLRYGDLSQSKDRKLTEYILIGTLTSFGFALGTGLLISMFLNNSYS